MGLNPGTIYWMDIFPHIFVEKIVNMFFEKTENKRKRGQGWPIFEILTYFVVQGSGCDSVGMAVACSTKEMHFKSSQWQILFTINCIEKGYLDS